MATIRKRGRRWQVQVRKAGALPVSGSFATRAAAERWARAREHEIDEGRARTGVAATGTLGQLLARYEREVDPIRRFGTTKQTVLRGLIRGLGDVRLRELSAEHVIRFARQRHRTGASPATVQMDLSYLGAALRASRALWRLSIDDRAVLEAREALRLVGIVGRSRERDRRPTQAELDALFAHWRGRLPHMIDVTRFAIGSALRLGEICRITRADLDPAARTVLVRSRKHPRAPRDQIVPLLDVTGIDALAIALRQPVSADGRLFPFRPESITRAWQRACAALGLEDLRFHDMRHEATSRLFEAGLSIEQVALVTGHKSWTNLKRYTQLQPASLTAAFPARAPSAKR